MNNIRKQRVLNELQRHPQNVYSINKLVKSLYGKLPPFDFIKYSDYVLKEVRELVLAGDVISVTQPKTYNRNAGSEQIKGLYKYRIKGEEL